MKAAPLLLLLGHMTQRGYLILSAIQDGGDPYRLCLLIDPIVDQKILHRHFSDTLGTPRLLAHERIATGHSIQGDHLLFESVRPTPRHLGLQKHLGNIPHGLLDLPRGVIRQLYLVGHIQMPVLISAKASSIPFPFSALASPSPFAITAWNCSSVMVSRVSMVGSLKE